MPSAALVSVHAGRIAPLGPEGVPSGFIKTAVTRAVAVGVLGLAGDEQTDLSVHGGPEKAVYAYPTTHYAAWAAEFPEHQAGFIGGGMGENLAIAGNDCDVLSVRGRYEDESGEHRRQR